MFYEVQTIKQQAATLYTLPLLGGITCLLLEILLIYLRVDFLSFPTFLLGFFIIAYLPGRLILKWLRLSLSPIERFTLELGLGYVSTSLIYFICRSLKVEFAYVLLITVLAVYYFYGLYNAARYPAPEGQGQVHSKEEPWPAFVLPRDIFSWSFIVVFVLVIASCVWLHFTTWVFNQDGSLTLGTLVDRDSVFHVSLAGELAMDFLPRYQYAGNFPFVYHFFPELFASLFMRWVNLTSWDLVVRYLPMLHFVLLFFGTFILTRKLTQNHWISLLAGFLIVFMGNMGFIHNFISQSHAWEGNPVPLYYYLWEMYFIPHIFVLNVNPIKIATAVVILGFFCLVNYTQEDNFRWLVLSATF